MRHIAWASLIMVLPAAGCHDRSQPSAERINTRVSEPKSDAEPGLDLEMEPADVYLGILSPGESTTMRVWLKNNSPSPVQPANFRSTCPCLTLKLPAEVAPFQRAMMELHFSGDEVHGFVGGLRVELEIADASGMTLARCHVVVDLTSSAALTLSPMGPGSKP